MILTRFVSDRVNVLWWSAELRVDPESDYGNYY